MKILKFIIALLLFSSCSLNKKNDKWQAEEKENIYKVLVDMDGYYKKYGNEIAIYQTGNYFYFFIDKNGKKVSADIDDSLRLSILNRSVKTNKFTEMLTPSFYQEILMVKDSLQDPINLGYLLTQHESGKSLIDFITKRGYFNVCTEPSPESNGEPDMPEPDIIEYHLEKVHIVNDTLAIYKNTDCELTLEEENDRIYFILTKPKKKWLLDDIIICKMEEEEHYDMELIGKPSPIQYYEPKYYE